MYRIVSTVPLLIFQQLLIYVLPYQTTFWYVKSTAGSRQLSLQVWIQYRAQG